VPVPRFRSPFRLRLRSLLLLCAGACLHAGLTGCGDPAAPVPTEDSAATAPTPPATPEAALVWVEQAADDPEGLRRRLQVWPLEDEAFTFTSETQVALTWRLRLALEDLRIEDALADLARLEADYEGEGETVEGERFGARTLALGVFEGCLRAARRASEGARPDRSRTETLLTAAGRLLRKGDGTDRARLEGLRRWLLAEDAKALEAVLGVALPTEGVVVLIDDFALGELRLTDRLARWRREGARVWGIPIWRGQIRMGMRRMPAESTADERRSLEAHAAGVDLPLWKDVSLASERLTSLGLGRQDVVVLVIDGEGRIVGRQAGIQPDLRALEPAVQRLLTR
jgi:hypothetical protein